MKMCFRCLKKYRSDNNMCPFCGYIEEIMIKEPRYLEPGIQLQNRYMVGNVIGSGGFGITYYAWDTVLNQRVAIKEYLPGEFSTRTGRQTQVTIYGGEKTEQFMSGKEKFHEESKRLAGFRNVPGIVQIYDSFEENGTVYIVMEYLEGETLDARLKREGKISEKEAVEIMLPVLQALDRVHKEGILHRDIAPNNIFLCKNGEVKLLDFGAARSATGSHSKSLTVLYKEGYTPEEQYRSRGGQGTWTDVYACAATLYKMLTGKIPPGAMERRRKDTIKAPSKNGAKVSHEVDVAILNALNVEVKYRTQSVEQFIKELTGEVKGKKHFIRTVEKRIGKLPLGVKIGTGLTVTLAGLFLVMLFTGIIHFETKGFDNLMITEGESRVPNVVNKEIGEAQKTTEEAGLAFIIKEKRFSLEIPENRILSQEIKAGEVVEKGQQLEVIVSAGLNSMTVQELEENGVEMVEIPDLQYQDRDEAMSMLIAAGMKVNIEYEKTGIVEGGKVTKQSAGVGEKLIKGQDIILTVEDFVVDWTDAEPFEIAVRRTLDKVEGDIWASEMLNIKEMKYGSADAFEESALKRNRVYHIKPLSNCIYLEDLRVLGTGEYGVFVTDPEYDSQATIDDWSSLRNLIHIYHVEFYGINIEEVSWMQNYEKLIQMYLFDVGSLNDVSCLKDLPQFWNIPFRGNEFLDGETLCEQLNGVLDESSGTTCIFNIP